LHARDKLFNTHIGGIDNKFINMNLVGYFEQVSHLIFFF